jgi:molybdopterin synthase sulfur carrier subunit
MAIVDLKLINFYYLKTQKHLLQYKADSVEEVIEKFLQDYKSKLDENMLSKDEKGLSSDTIILVNGRNIEYLDGMNTKLKDEDRLVFSLRMAGG